MTTSRLRIRKVFQRKPSIDYFAQLEEREDLDDYGYPKKKKDESESELFSDIDDGALEPAIDFWTDFDWE